MLILIRGHCYTRSDSQYNFYFFTQVFSGAFPVILLTNVLHEETYDYHQSYWINLKKIIQLRRLRGVASYSKREKWKIKRKIYIYIQIFILDEEAIYWTWIFSFFCIQFGKRYLGLRGVVVEGNDMSLYKYTRRKVNHVQPLWIYIFFMSNNFLYASFLGELISVWYLNQFSKGNCLRL